MARNPIIVSNWSWPLLLIGLSIVARILFFGAMPAGTFNTEIDFYYSVLRADFWDWVSFSPRKPPLYGIMHVPLVLLFDNATIVSHRLAEWQVGVLDCLAIGLLASAAQRLGAFGIVAALYLSLYSLALLGLEVRPIHNDYPYPFCTALVLWTIARFVQDRRAVIGMGMAGALLAMTSTVAPIVFGATAVLLLAVLHRDQTWSKRATMLALALGPIVFVSVILSVKTHMAVGTFSAANGAGHTSILNVAQQITWDSVRLRRMAVEAGAPDWYLWCFDNAGTPGDTSPKAIFPRLLGHCVIESPPPPQAIWPVDFRGLENELERRQASEILEIVRQDRRDAEAGGRLFTPFGFSSTRFFSAYSRWNVRIAKHVFWSAPKAWIKHAWLRHNIIWLRLGPFSLKRMVYPPYWIAGGKEAPAANLLDYSIKRFARLISGTYRGLPWALGLVFAGFFSCWLFRSYGRSGRGPVGAIFPALSILASLEAALSLGRNSSREKYEQARKMIIDRGTLSLLRPSPRLVAACIAFVVPTVAMAVIYLGISGTEEERLFEQTLPYLCVGGSVFASLLLRPLILIVPARYR